MNANPIFAENRFLGISPTIFTKQVGYNQASIARVAWRRQIGQCGTFSPTVLDGQRAGIDAAGIKTLVENINFGEDAIA